MLYACIGAHRSGKTSTAKLIAEQLGIEFIDSSFNVARQFGFEPNNFMSLEDRLAMQMQVLTHHCETISKATRPAITDRTPLDFYAYTLAEYGILSHQQVLGASTLASARQFAELCISATIMHYDMVFLLDPLPFYVVDDTKSTPAENPAFQLHIDALINGALSKAYSDLNYAIVPFMEQQRRADHIAELIVSRLDDIQEQRKVAGMH